MKTFSQLITLKILSKSINKDKFWHENLPKITPKDIVQLASDHDNIDNIDGYGMVAIKLFHKITVFSHHLHSGIFHLWYYYRTRIKLLQRYSQWMCFMARNLSNNKLFEGEWGEWEWMENWWIMVKNFRSCDVLKSFLNENFTKSTWGL